MTRSDRTLPSAHPDDPHLVNRSGWLRAAVLGANDGIVSVSSLIVGVAASGAGPQAVALAGVAGLAAGAMSMAAGEYVSVSSQSDIERADIAREKQALHDMPADEMAELAGIWRARGLTPQTAATVARELHEHDALAAHIRDEMGLSEVHAANPLQAAFTSGLTFSAAAALPVLASWFAPADTIIPVVLVVTLLALALLGALGAWAGRAPMARAVARVVIWGAFAMAVTAGVGRLFGVSV
ncbi:VIT1/CCC1 transporter family protein [Paracoccus jiaweipingae]|uniref:VIT1/CCC1 transporter family protein n=1 Tax=unclassified Paracoccus (in: a-proteobacteria) TaxID=2688777 RepID=UPI0037B74C47